MGDRPEHPELPQIVTVGASSVTEQPYSDRFIWKWLGSEPISETVTDRMEADRRSVTREMEAVFA